MTKPVLEVNNLSLGFATKSSSVNIVNDISFSINEGEVLALVGESGSGKSLTALSCIRLLPKPGAIANETEMLFNGRDINKLTVPEMRSVRGKEISMIFQEPMSSLNPVVSVGKQVVECIRLHEKVSFDEARKRTIELFEKVGIPDAAARFNAFPHQLSGGLKQRIMIAMAISLKSKLLIADEPTTALDVTVQRQIIRLMKNLQKDMGTSILFITHDLGVVNEIADRVAVMYAGQIVEYGTRKEVLHNPSHPYTRSLLNSIPSQTPAGERLPEIEGMVPKPGCWPEGCRFSTRCHEVEHDCHTVPPEFHTTSTGQISKCHFACRGEE